MWRSGVPLPPAGFGEPGAFGSSGKPSADGDGSRGSRGSNESWSLFSRGADAARPGKVDNNKQGSAAAAPPVVAEARQSSSSGRRRMRRASASSRQDSPVTPRMASYRRARAALLSNDDAAAGATAPPAHGSSDNASGHRRRRSSGKVGNDAPAATPGDAGADQAAGSKAGSKRKHATGKAPGPLPAGRTPQAVGKASGTGSSKAKRIVASGTGGSSGKRAGRGGSGGVGGGKSRGTKPVGQAASAAVSEEMRDLMALAGVTPSRATATAPQHQPVARRTPTAVSTSKPVSGRAFLQPMFPDATEPAGAPAAGAAARLTGFELGTAALCLVRIDETLVASGDASGVIVVWDVESRASKAVLRYHTAAVYAMVVTPGGRLFSAGADASIAVWSPRDGRRLAEIEAHDDWVTCLQTVSNGRRLVSGSDDATLRVWDLQSSSFRCLQTLRGHDGAVKALAVAPNGSIVLSGGKDHTVIVWDLIRGASKLSLTGHRLDVTCLLVLDSKRVVSGSADWELRISDYTSGQTLSVFQGHQGRVSALAPCLDAPTFMSASHDRTCGIWHPETGRVAVLTGHTKPATSVVAVDAATAVSASLDGTLRAWNLQDATEDRPATAVAAASTPAAAAAVAPARIPVDAAIKPVDDQSSHAAAVTSIAVMPGTQPLLALSGSSDGELLLWRAGDAAAQVVMRLRHNQQRSVTCIAAAAPDVFVSGTAGGVVSIWTLPRMKVRDCRVSSAGAAVTCLALTPDTADRIVVGTDDDRICLVDRARACVLVSVLARLPQCPLSMLVDASGLSVLVGMVGGAILSYSLDPAALRDVQTTPVSALKGHLDDVNCLVYADRDTLVSGSDDGTIRMWDCHQLEVFRCQRVLSGHTGWVAQLAVVSSSSDGAASTTILSSGGAHRNDTTLRLWDLKAADPALGCTADAEDLPRCLAVGPSSDSPAVLIGRASGRVSFHRVIV